jgi:hypothetical protein
LQEVLGGLMDLDPALWLHPRTDEHASQLRHVREFRETWKDYDWTADLMGPEP